MTKIAWVADVHLGNHRRYAGAREASLNQRCRDGLDVLRRAVQRAHDLRCVAFVVLGDLLDTQRPEPQLLAEVQAIFKPCSPDMPVLLLVGNHDQVSTAPGDHALGPLAPYATVVDKPTVLRARGVELGLVPFRPGAASEWLPDVVRGMGWSNPTKVVDRVLGVHLGVRDTTTAPWLRNAPDAVDAELLASLAKGVGARQVLAGNWHDRRAWSFDEDEPDGVRILQLGALVPTGFDNPGLLGYGTLALWEDGTLTHEVLPGPRFVVQDGTAGLDKLAEDARAGGYRVYVQVKVRPGELGAAVSALGDAAFSESDNINCPVLLGEAVVDGAVVEAQARESACAATNARSMSAALDAYMETVPLEEGVDRAEVATAARGYLGMTGGAS